VCPPRRGATGRLIYPSDFLTPIMSLRKRILAGSAILAGGQILAQSCALVRNVIIARLISPEDFGIAATFVITVSLFEMISNLAVDRLLVQASDGDEPRFLATAHLFQTLRGLLNAGMIFGLAWPISHLFSVPDARWAFQCLAIVPLVRGFTHLDIKRLHRQLRFKRDVVAETVPQIILVVVVWPIGRWFGDYSAMLWLLLGQAIVSTVMSHLLSLCPYRWALDRAYLYRIGTFGWPLLINGLLMFGIFQGDKIIVGTFYSMTALGMFAVAFTATMMPTLIMVRISSAVCLPVLSSVKDVEPAFQHRFKLANQMLALVAITIASALIVGGQGLIDLVFGAKYAGAGLLIGWLAVMQMFRMVRAAPSLAAIARGDTRTMMLSNIVRSGAIGMMLVVAVSGTNIVWIAIFATLGEVAATIFAARRMRMLHHVPYTTYLWPPFIVALLAVAIGTTSVWLDVPERAFIVLSSMVFVSLITMAIALMCFRSIREEMIQAIRSLRAHDQVCYSGETRTS